MNIHIDKDIMVIGDTLLQASPALKRRNVIQIDEQMCGARIRRIGDGAMMNEKVLHKVIVGEGIEELGARSFSSHDYIEHLVLPESLNKIEEDAFAATEIVRLEMRRSLSRASYDRIHSEALEVTGGELLLGRRYYSEPGTEEIGKDLKLLYTVINATGCEQHTAQLSERMNCIFLKRDGKKDNGYINREFPFGKMPPLGEEMFVKKLIVDNLEEVVFNRSEKNYQQALTNDIGAESMPRYKIMKCGLISFDDRDTVVKDDGRVSVLFKYESGLAYWFTTLLVSYRGHLYHIARKHFLLGNGPEPVIVRDHGVYDDKGTLCYGDLKKMIYGKYRFMSLLM